MRATRPRCASPPRLAADGRTEFALQQRDADDGWSERLLTRARFFPAAATAGRWLSSTPLTVRTPGAGDDAAGTEVRVTARRLADDRIEFALQQREADGGWGERLLPRARFFPATATVGRWLSSTPLTVSLPEPAASPDTAEDGGSVASDRAVLVALYEATDGTSWMTSTYWLSDAPLDAWYGVGTNSAGRVTELVLWFNGLTGPIPAELGDLTNLELLWLEHNQLTGPIPAELGDLTNLQTLNLDSTELTGPIPAELGALTNLERLFLRYNELTGPIPAGLGALTNLQTLDLEWLSLGDNELTGRIPGELGDLTNLESLDLGGNGLTGPIPAELGDLTNLQVLWLTNLAGLEWPNGPTGLRAAIPAELWAQASPSPTGWNGTASPRTATAVTSLWGNGLTGPIPAELGALTNLESAVPLVQRLTGPIPAELGDLTNLEWLDLGFN